MTLALCVRIHMSHDMTKQTVTESSLGAHSHLGFDMSRLISCFKRYACVWKLPDQGHFMIDAT